MRNRKTIGTVLMATVVSWCSTGCIDGVDLGVQSGVEAAISSTIETIVTNALAPLLELGGGEGGE